MKKQPKHYSFFIIVYPNKVMSKAVRLGIVTKFKVKKINERNEFNL